MGTKTGIAWTDATWNPVRGCSRVSKGCMNCYAETMAGRFSGPGQPYEGLVERRLKTLGEDDEDARVVSRWNGVVRLVPEHLADPLRWRKPRRIFVNSMSDLFHEALARTEIAEVFAVMAAAPQHTFQVLTKRPERMREFVTLWLGYGGAPLPNVHLGVSVEDQAAADERIPVLLSLPAAVRWVSYEPALGAVDFEEWLRCQRCNGRTWLCADPCTPTLDWIVVGGESGARARPFDLRWAANVVSQCEWYGCPCFVKQMGDAPLDGLGMRGDFGRHGADPSRWPEELRVQEFPTEVSR